MFTASKTTLSDWAAVMLAGGQGSRLYELTDVTCKPAVSFVDGRRIVDWTMANLTEAAPARLIVATQYKPDALVSHINAFWRKSFVPGTLALRFGPTITGSSKGYRGTADAVTANMAELNRSGVDTVLVVAADHVYRMDYAAMVAAHRKSGRPVTVAAHRVPVAEASAFGVIASDANNKAISFIEKPRKPAPTADDPKMALVSMGIYAFDRAWLADALKRDAEDKSSSHDFGHDILPKAVTQGLVTVYDPAQATPDFFWRDVGTLDALRQTCIDLHNGEAKCPSPIYPQNQSAIRPTAVLGEGSVVLPGAMVRRGARLRNVLVAPGADVPSNLTAGFDPETDSQYFRVTPGGTVLITAHMLARKAVEHVKLPEIAVQRIAYNTGAHPR